MSAPVSALRISEVGLQEGVLIDPPHQAVDVRGYLFLSLHQGQHNVQSLLPVTWQVPSTLTNNKKQQRNSIFIIK